MKRHRGKWMAVRLAVAGTLLFVGNANAYVTMPEREHVQTVVWLGEFISFLTAVVIGVFVWRISKRDSKNKKSKHDE